MTKFLLAAAAALTLAAPVFAADRADRLNFTRDGVHYVATVVTQGGVQRIIGRETNTGREFVLRVVDGQVSGIYGGSDVAYAVPSSALTMQTASR